VTKYWEYPQKEAIDVQPGDFLVGPHIFVDHGQVVSVIVSEDGVQVNFVGGTKVVRPERYRFHYDPEVVSA
jgi:hypothetical protein